MISDNQLLMKTLLSAFIIFIISAVLRFYHLSYPEAVIFDEVHFGKYVSAYCCTGERIFDIHPPHTKIITAGFAKLLGYQGGQDFTTINTFFPAADAYSLRFFSALCGTLLAPLIFFLVLQLGGSINAAICASVLIIFDNAFLVQSRLIALDTPLLLGTFSSLLFVVMAAKQKQAWKRYLYCFAAGFFAGLAVGSKFTGLISLFLPVVVAFFDLYKKHDWQNIKYWLIAAIIFLLSFSIYYALGWYLHFELLNKPGPGDIWGILNGSFLENTIHLHKTMLSANAGLTATHPDMSMWWGWPWMHSPLFYWSAPDKVIYLLGNPLVWCSTSLLFFTLLLLPILICLFNSNTSEENQKIKKPVLQREIRFRLVLIGYAASFLPLILVSRGLFLYHYFTPLIFSIIYISLWLDNMGWLTPHSILKKMPVYLILLAIIVSFYLVLPLSYGLVDSNNIRDIIFSFFPQWQ